MKERQERLVIYAVHLRVYTFAVLVGSNARAYRGAGSSQQRSRGLFLGDRGCDEPLQCV
jgi:hypothetical protein